MKNLFCLVCIFLYVQTAYSQDKIVKTNKDTVLCKVLEVGASEVQFKNWANLAGATQSLPLSQVYKIIYEGGEEKVYTLPQAPKPKVVEKPKDNSIGISLPKLKKKSTDSGWLSENQIGFGLAYGIANMNTYGGTIIDGTIHYAYNFNERWKMQVLLSAGVGYDYGQILNVDFESENYSLGGGISFHYNWISRERFTLHSGLGLGFMSWEAYMLSSTPNFMAQFEPGFKGYGSPELVAQRVTENFDYLGLGGDLELLGVDYLLGDHFGIYARLGIGYSGIGNMGLFWAW